MIFTILGVVVLWWFLRGYDNAEREQAARLYRVEKRLGLHEDDYDE